MLPCGKWGLPVVAGIAFLCGGGFWVLKSLAIDPTKDNDIDAEVEVEVEVEEGEDRISALPDDVMHLIISRLDVIDAVRTSILSRRWRHAYTFITQVRFSCVCIWNGGSSSAHSRRKLGRFQRKVIRAMNTILLHHSGAKIMYLELFCCYRVFASKAFRTWMEYVGRLGVEQLTIKPCSPCAQQVKRSFYAYLLPPLPASTLKHPHLNLGYFRKANNALKILELVHVALRPEAVEGLLSNCWSLESLKFKYCVLPSKLDIHGRDLKLQSLTLYYCHNVAEVDLSAVSLITCDILNIRRMRLSFSSVPMLRNLHIQMSGIQLTPYVFEKVAKDVPHLKSMIFHTKASLFDTKDKFFEGGTLSNLTQLDLWLEDINKVDLLFLAPILDVCPLLHKFHVAMHRASVFNGIWAHHRVVRRHTLLKEMEFSGFRQTRNEYNIIFYILDAAVSLERLSIFVNFRYYNEENGRWLGAKSDDLKKHRIIRKRLQRKVNSKNTEIIIA